MVGLRSRRALKYGSYRYDGAGIYQISNCKIIIMPVEIKELVIRAVLDENQNVSSINDGHHKDHLVQECVTQVLKILKKKNRR